MRVENLGTFEVKSGKLCATDPCYSRGTWCAAYDIPAKSGTWKAGVWISNEGDWGLRVQALDICHVDALKMDHVWKAHPSEIGVDSGQAGFFDEEIYPHSETGDYDDKESFYGVCCSATHDENDPKKNAGIVFGRGVVSSSGFGDGGYELLVARDADENVIAARIIFIPKEDNE